MRKFVFPPTFLATNPDLLSPLARQFCAYNCEFIPPQEALPSNRRDFYKLALFVAGKSRLHAGTQSWDVQGPALLFSNRQVSYTWESFEEQAGLFCEFTEEFLYGPERSGSLRASPLFALGASPVLILSVGQAAEFSTIFKQLISGLEADYSHKYDVLRHQLHLLLHRSQQLLPPPPHERTANAASRLSAQFLDLLERQFPIHTPAQPLRLRSAQDFAPLLAVHVNHLNRAVRKITGKTTTEHLTERLVQEAQALLQHTTWGLTEVAQALGFDYPTYFHNFVKKHTGRTPKQIRENSKNI